MTGFVLHDAERIAAAAAAARDVVLRASPARRREHGVVHTPAELARLVARAAHDMLVRQGVAEGLFDARVHVIDPASGPGAFVAATLAFAAERSRRVPRITAIDLDADALRAAEVLVPLASEQGTPLALVQADMLRDDAILTKLAADDAIPVLIGNPPWSVARAVATPAMQALLEDFRRDEHGQRLAERKLGVLADAYVRFIRATAEVVRRARAAAVVGLVTNASFLDGPVHRGMRGALCAWFDAIDVIELGGSALLARVERSARQRDDNVFGVRTAATITLLGRSQRYTEPRSDEPRKELARVRHARVFGDRRAKLEVLGRTPPSQLDYLTFKPSPPLLRFVPTRSGNHGVRYASFPSLAEIMPFHREGVQTNRDALVIDGDRSRLLERLHAIAPGCESQADNAWLVPRTHFDPARARRALAEVLERDPEGERGLAIAPIAYRPFDLRYFSPVSPLCHRPRPELLAAFRHEPLALVAVRKDRSDVPYAHFGAARVVIDNCYLSTRSSCRARAFPVRDPEGRENLAPDFRRQLEERLGHAVSARDYSSYALAVLAAPKYRERYQEELRLDYPRLPWPDGSVRFASLVRAGEGLAQLLVPQASAPAEALDAHAQEEAQQPRQAAAGGPPLRIGHFVFGPSERETPVMCAKLEHLRARLAALDTEVRDLLDAASM